MQPYTLFFIFTASASALVLMYYVLWKNSYWDSHTAAWDLRRKYIREHPARRESI